MIRAKQRLLSRTSLPTIFPRIHYSLSAPLSSRPLGRYHFSRMHMRPSRVLLLHFMLGVLLATSQSTLGQPSKTPERSPASYESKIRLTRFEPTANEQQSSITRRTVRRWASYSGSRRFTALTPILAAERNSPLLTTERNSPAAAEELSAWNQREPSHFHRADRTRLPVSVRIPNAGQMDNRKQRRTYVIVGAALGGAVGAVVLSRIRSNFCDGWDTCTPSPFGTAIIGAGLGGVVGASVGWGVFVASHPDGR